MLSASFSQCVIAELYVPNAQLGCTREDTCDKGLVVTAFRRDRGYRIGIGLGIVLGFGWEEGRDGCRHRRGRCRHTEGGVATREEALLGMLDPLNLPQTPDTQVVIVA